MLPDRGFGDVVDVGCGRGQLGVLLLEAGAARSVFGLDRNAAQLAEAEAAAGELAFRAVCRDLLRDQSLPAADTVFLIDVLYQLDTPVQHALLASAAAAARRCVVIRSADPGRGVRSAISLGLEVLGRRIWPHAGARVNPRPVPDLAATLTAAGFAITAAPCWRGTPFANVLLIGRREPSPAPCAP